MTAPLVHAHDSRVHFKLDEIAEDLRDFDIKIQGTADALIAANEAFVSADKILGKACEKVVALMDRRKEIAADVAILREMLGVR